MDELSSQKSLVGRKRYLTFEIIAENDIEFSDFVNVFWNTALNFLGERGASKAGIWVVKDLWDPKQKKGVIKCSHRAIESVRASLSLITRIGDNRIIVHIIGVSGTLRSAKTKFFGMRDLISYSEKSEDISEKTQNQI